MPPVDATALARTWIHSHEEDTAGSMVYRPAGFAFPPARGRSGFTLNADGSAAEFGPGAADQPSTGSARWALVAGDRLQIRSDSATTSSRLLGIESHTLDKLVLRKTP